MSIDKETRFLVFQGVMKIELEVDETKVQDFIQNVALNVDIFMHGYCGYWLYGAHHDKARNAWLVYEKSDERPPSDTLLRQRIEDWEHTDEWLPTDGWFVLDEQVARKAYVEGVKLWGLDWCDDADGPRYDIVMQRALLGEVRYG